ncbi:ephexin-1 [Chanos chanos]|uniref:Ephexin-1 n=1 Tax=Chanos chanos TaxID=29144 RepID=A0A6J2WWV4_CHACN|nr:ephexin-1-like [Chanos chanos]
MPPKPVIPPKPNPNTPPQNPDPGRAGVPQEPGGGRTGQAGRVRQIADTINRTIGRTVDTTTKDSRRNGGPPLTHHTRVKLSPPSNRGNCPQSALSSSSSSSSSSSPSPSSSFTPSNQERERMMKTGVGVHRPEQFNPSHLSEERNRSEPDGSEEDVYERLTDEQCSAAPPAEEEKHCHCVCHLQIPGMKLVWVPTSEEEIPNPAYTPPERRKLPPLPVQTERKRTTQPALAYMLSPRGGRPPRSTQSSHTSTVKHSHLPSTNSEPVYEAYREDVTKETPAKKGGSLRSCRASVRSDLGLKAPGGVKGHWGLAGARSWRGRGPQQAVLWQDRDDVRKSGILQKLSHTEIQRQETMFEVFTSEESYLSSLCVLKDHFLGSRELIDTLVIHERKSLFSNILQVYEVSERFMADLHERVYENAVIPDVCDIIHHHAQNNFSAYTDYVRNQLYQEKTYTTLMQTNRPFAVVMKRLEESPLCQRLPFNSFLLLPFQRITRIKILIQSILKRTAENSKEEVTASKALACVSEIIKEANSQVGQMRQMEELIQIANMLEFDRLKAVPIVSKTRHLEKQGELQLMYKGSSLFNIGLKFTPVYLFLFNNLLILTNKKGPDRFVVMDHAHRSLVQVQTFGATDSNERAFCLTLLENHLGHTCEYIFKTETESDMHRWVAAFPSVSNLCEEEEEDTVYEDWDCPQFQCETEYTAQQADELSLEPGDIINVLRKTNEGWFEGVRLCDRQRGWFPQEYVSEITNEHQRRRNLREQYRIARAASIVAMTRKMTNWSYSECGQTDCHGPVTLTGPEWTQGLGHA